MKILKAKVDWAFQGVPYPLDYTYHFADTDEGGHIFIMDKFGYSFGRLYWFDGDDPMFTMDHLSVQEDRREEGLGTEMQKIREVVAKNLGGKEIYLYVKKDTWQQKWYERREYSYYADYTDDQIWMIKQLQ